VLTNQPDLRVSELCTVAEFARECGGYLDVYAEAQAGTTFRLYLPRAGDAPKDERHL
jgi:sensor histidine kinase regulating citrate/malate metabolism